MKPIFLSPDYLSEKTMVAAPTDLAVISIIDDGFTVDDGVGMNYYISGNESIDRFGRNETCAQCGVRPAIKLDAGDEKKLQNAKKTGRTVTAELGRFPFAILDSTLRQMAEREYRAGNLTETGEHFTICGEEYPVYGLGAKLIVCLRVKEGSSNGYIKFSDGTLAIGGEEVFIELRPVRWIYDREKSALVCCNVLFAGLSREEAENYLLGNFMQELLQESSIKIKSGDEYRIGEHDELSLIRSYVEAGIPVFIHGLSGDGKSDRVKEIDPQCLDIELVNETPETINGRAIYNETTKEIIDIKPAWLVMLERICEDGKLHILFFDELTNATKQTQSIIFKIVLGRFVNNRWPLPENARIVAAGNDRSESTVSHDLAEPLFGRFAHIYIHTTLENWMPWAVRNRINPYVLEFLANNSLYLRTPYTGTESNADPRRWEMVSKALYSSGNDFSLLAPIVGRDAAEAFIRFFAARHELASLGNYSDEDIARFSTAVKYQIAQQCLCCPASDAESAKLLVTRLGPEFLAWYEYIMSMKAML